MLPYDQVLFAGVLVASYCASLALNRKNVQALQSLLPVTRVHLGGGLHVAQMLFCMLGGVPIFGYQAMLLTLACAVVAWGVNNALGPRMAGVLTWTGMFGLLTWLHFIRPTAWEMHISVCVMLMTMRYTSHVGDGKDRTRGSLIEWLGWTYFIPGFFTGPVMSLSDYQRWHAYVTTREPHAQPDATDAEATRPPQRAFVRALWYVPFVLVGQMAFPVSGVTRFLPTDGMLYRVFYAWMAMWCIKCRYYFAWGVSEAAFVASDASRFVWHRGRNVDVWRVELGRSTHSVLKNWNMSTADWLKRYVYLPLLAWLNAREARAPETISIVATNVVSAVWHGVAPGYYVTFVCGGVCTLVARLVHSYIDPHVDSSSSALLRSMYEVSMVVWTNVLVITFGLPFQLFSWSATWEAWKGLFFIGHVWLGGALLLVFAEIAFFSRGTRTGERSPTPEKAKGE